MKFKNIILVFIILSGLQMVVSAQERAQAELPANPGLDDYISFALANRGQIQQRLIDEEIGEREIASALSGWFPQIAASATYNHNVIIPTNVIGDQVIAMGQPHTSAMVLQADQQILNPQLFQASKAAKFIRQNNAIQTEMEEINTVVEVSKAYYDILTSYEQLNIIQENLTRIQKQLEDAQARYETGIVDRTDQKRAQISLSNTRADLKRTEEILKYKYAYFKELIGLNEDVPINLQADQMRMEQDFFLDTNFRLEVQNRIEYKQLETLKQLQQINTQYNRWQYLPTMSAFYNYAWDFRDTQFQQLYNDSSPRSVLGLSLRIPIFQGTKRVQEIRRSQLLEERLDWDLFNLSKRINTAYELALASYKANLNDWNVARENVVLSEEVYEIIKLQYDEGIKTYLDLMVSETDLKTSQLNYLNTLYAVLSAKLDVQKALGQITIK